MDRMTVTNGDRTATRVPEEPPYGDRKEGPQSAPTSPDPEPRPCGHGFRATWPETATCRAWMPASSATVCPVLSGETVAAIFGIRRPPSTAATVVEPCGCPDWRHIET